MTNYHREVHDSASAMRAYRKLPSVWSGESALMTKTMILILAALEKRKKHEKRKPSAFNIFVSEGMKDGKAMKEIAELWQKQKQEETKKP